MLFEQTKGRTTIEDHLIANLTSPTVVQTTSDTHQQETRKKITSCTYYPYLMAECM